MSLKDLADSYSNNDLELRRKWERECNEAQLRDDVQEFMQVYNLGNVLLGSVSVRFRTLVPDFYAKCRVIREGKQRTHQITAEAPSRAGALEALASAVAAYLYPAKKL